MKKSLLLILSALLWVTGAFAQDAAVSGVITNKEGSPVPGASVIVKDTKLYAVADDNGSFSIAAPKTIPFTIRITSVGYKAQDFIITQLPAPALNVKLVDDNSLTEVVITSRRRIETAQSVPIPITVVGGSQIDNAGAFNVNRVKELVPSLQLYSSNPRNTGINIRGLGSPFGLTNDGLDPGVGFYVDGVYYARPAAATLDFIDIDRIEVLRGPQGTLFGKNTSSGAINITTRKPSFTPQASFESSFGNYGYIQAKASVSGPLSKTVAARVSFSGTQRNGLVDNVATGRATNDINNLGARAQLLFKPSDKFSLLLAGDFSDQKPDGYAQVIAGVVTTKRSGYRQFNNIIADPFFKGYKLPSLNPFDRIIDHDTPWRSGNQLGGVSVNADLKVGPGTLTSTTAWRYWNWDPSNDRDFTGLPVLAKSQNPAKHRNWSQEVRYAGQFSEKLSGVVGLYYISQEVKITGTEESGSAQWRFSKSTRDSIPGIKDYTYDQLWALPGLLEGYGIYTNASIKSQSAAAFASVDYEVVKGLHVLPGIRFNYDNKDVNYNRVAKGGLDTANTPYRSAIRKEIQKIKNGVYSNQQYVAGADEKNFTYSITVAYRPTNRINAFATYSTSFKPVGVNVAGLPSKTVNGVTTADLDLAVIKPENTKHYELGVKTTPLDNLIFNVTLHNSDIKNYQTNVQSPELGVNRGYIANADKVNVKGFEVDANYRANANFSFYGAAAYTDAKYVKFTNAPLPLEETGTKNAAGQDVAFKDISGGRLPGISKWAGSLGGEFTTDTKFFGKPSKFFFAADGAGRSSFSSSPSPSAFLNIQGYVIANARVGFRAPYGISAFVWSRNILDKNYFEQLLPAGGNAGHYAAVLGDQRTFGATIRYVF